MWGYSKTLRVSFTLWVLSVFSAKPTDSYSCSLPSSWDGEWFINDFAHSPSIGINASKNLISRHTGGEDDSGNLGICIWNELDYYIFFNNETDTLVCVHIIERHANVLESREAFEYRKKNEWDEENPKELCDSLLTPDAYLTWVRIKYNPIPCPFSGSFKFKYQKAGGETCATPASYSSSCNDNTKLELQYEACHNVLGSEAKDDYLTCVGHWKESGFDYFVADRVSLNYVPTALQHRLQCYIFKEITKPNPNPTLSNPYFVVGYEIGISDTATCTSLHDPKSGATTLFFERENVGDFEERSCSFPTWVSSHRWVNMAATVELVVEKDSKNKIIHVVPRNSMVHNAPNWTPLQPSRKVKFFPLLSHSMSTMTCLKKTNILGMTDDHVAVIAKMTFECKIDEICLHFVRRSNFIFQLYYLERATLPRSDFYAKCFNATLSELKKEATMISIHGDKIECPNQGKFSINKNAGKPSANLESSDVDVTANNISSPMQMHSLFTSNGEWSVGCEDPKKVEINPVSPNSVDFHSLSCIDGWNVNDTSFTVLSLDPEIPHLKLSCMISVPNNYSSSEKLHSTGLPQSKLPQLYLVDKDCIQLEDFQATKIKTKENMMNEIENSSNAYRIQNLQPIEDTIDFVQLLYQAPCSIQAEPVATSDARQQHGKRDHEDSSSDDHLENNLENSSADSVIRLQMSSFLLLLSMIFFAVTL